MAMTGSLSLMQRKALLFIVCLLPFGLICYKVLTDDLGTDPVKAVIHLTGEWSIRFLLLVFLVSPLRQWFRRLSLLRYRRMLGLYAWFYTSLHFLAVATFLFAWDWLVFQEELVERPYVIVGFLAWLLMLPLGLTSSNYAVRLLRKRWSMLHRLIYPVMVLAWLHIAWQARSSYFDAFVYGLIIFVLFLPRIKILTKGR